MQEETPKKRNIFNLFIGLAFLGYGCYRIFTYLTGSEHTTFRMIIALGFIALGALDLYKYFGSSKKNPEN